MPQERLTMRKIREILRLKYEAAYQTEPSPGPAISPTAPLENICVGQRQAGIGWPLGELDEEEVYQKLFGDPTPEPETKSKLLPDWEEVRKELCKKGVTYN